MRLKPISILQRRARQAAPSLLGQGMVEYIVIVALIAVAAIGVYAAWGRTLRTQSAVVAREVAGRATDMTNVRDASNAAAGRANDPQKEGMSRYDYANDQR